MTKVFIFPFAGGSSYSFLDYSKYFKNKCDCTLIDYPGHGKRIRESLLYDAERLVSDLLDKYGAAFDGPSIFVGHSMGALIAYLLIHRLNLAKKSLPFHFVVCGRGAPSYQSRVIERHKMSDENFLHSLLELGGISQEVASSQELLDFTLPIIRADFQVIETYKHVSLKKLKIPITVLYGKEENMTEDDALSWKNETVARVETKCWSGNHFFVLDHVREIGASILDLCGLNTVNQF